MSGAAVAPSMLRGADAVTLGIRDALGISALASNPVPNVPLGVGKGIHPGRVVWAHNPDATDWEGPGQGHWWEYQHTKPEVVESMLAETIRQLTGKANDREAWHTLIRHFNRSHGHGNAGYRQGEKVVIKVNLVGCMAGGRTVDPQAYDLVRDIDYMNASPQMIRALLRQLVHAAGVPQADISVGDPLALFPNQYHDPLHEEFPNVNYLDHAGGNALHPRTRVQLSSLPFYWSARPVGTAQDYVPVSYAEAKYLINMANLKGHGAAGVTLCGKNHFGSLNRTPPAKGYYDMHTSTLAKALDSPGQYRAVVDFMGQAHIGGKTMLYLIDGLYSGIHTMDHVPRRWSSAPFNGQWTCSLLASQDPVAIDSVAYDFLRAELSNFRRLSGADDYLHEAALADNPPSGTFYDSDHPTPTTRLASLGVHEHWNNPQDKQYSKNLGKGEGIELIRVGPRAA